MTADAFLFWFLAVLTIGSAMSVLMFTNPIFSALSLAMTMVGVAALFVTLDAFFLAGVQLIVYAGAVMVLFVMVLMLFDLKLELNAFTRGKISGFLKITTVGVLAGLIIGSLCLTSDLFSNTGTTTSAGSAPVAVDTTKVIGQLLFSRYVFGFEALGVLLLVVAVGAVALARSKGGTHAKH
jgi:NADH-quinone oxidoreductase subunit J